MQHIPQRPIAGNDFQLGGSKSYGTLPRKGGFGGIGHQLTIGIKVDTSILVRAWVSHGFDHG
jgi:hypothetical protein